MQLRIFTEPQQGADYATLLAVARAADDLGFDAFFRSDHYLKTGFPRAERLHATAPSGLPGPTDAWVTLAGLARETTRVRLGTLMTAATFRHPGPLAITVAQVDEMSGGRVELGIGAGWYAAEHAAYGIPLPGLAERFGRFEEQLEVITGLWQTSAGKTFSYQGSYYTLDDSPALPKPAQRPRPPIVVGGRGHHRTPRLAARFADEFNYVFRSPQETAVAFTRAREACQAAGRDPSTLVCSAGLMVACGRTDAEAVRRAEAIGHELDEARRFGLAGSPAEAVDKLGCYAEIGVTRMYLQVLDLTDLDQLELIATEVMPQVR
ncbi:MAG TPA: LLM class F420-dependent oxidoreductase [Streptosporangiaceae bacterium]|nr:LLM class F420-dependent oxidoreductase [Streptosporangiaceae bacterium]